VKASGGPHAVALGNRCSPPSSFPKASRTPEIAPGRGPLSRHRPHRDEPPVDAPAATASARLEPVVRIGRDRRCCCRVHGFVLPVTRNARNVRRCMARSRRAVAHPRRRDSGRGDQTCHSNFTSTCTRSAMLLPISTATFASRSLRSRSLKRWATARISVILVSSPVGGQLGHTHVMVGVQNHRTARWVVSRQAAPE
jgi:hypothetical protein